MQRRLGVHGACCWIFGSYLGLGCSMMRRCVDWAKQNAVNEAVLPLILWGVSQETGLPGWLSALIKPDGFLTLNKWIDLYVASLTRFIFFYTWHKGGQHENKTAMICSPRGSTARGEPLLLAWTWLTSSQCLYLLCRQSVRDEAFVVTVCAQLTSQVLPSVS